MSRIFGFEIIGIYIRTNDNYANYNLLKENNQTLLALLVVSIAFIVILIIIGGYKILSRNSIEGFSNNLLDRIYKISFIGANNKYLGVQDNGQGQFSPVITDNQDI